MNASADARYPILIELKTYKELRRRKSNMTVRHYGAYQALHRLTATKFFLRWSCKYLVPSTTFNNNFFTRYCSTLYRKMILRTSWICWGCKLVLELTFNSKKKTKQNKKAISSETERKLSFVRSEMVIWELAILTAYLIFLIFLHSTLNCLFCKGR